jgi:hypothetical protein
LSIKRSSASTADPLAYYYYFYDWEIQTAECESETAQIDIDVTECTVGASELITSDIKIYPNPAKNTLYISGFPESSNEIIIELQNIEGKTLKQAVLNGNSLDISDLSTGMYVLKIQIQDEIIHQKLMIK